MLNTMDVIIDKKMIDIDEQVVTDCHNKPSSPTELEPSEEFPILYGLLTAPKFFKPKNSDELQMMPQEVEISIRKLQTVSSCADVNSQVFNDIISMEEADSQNLDFCCEDSDYCRSASSTPQSMDSSCNPSNENDSPIFMNYIRNNLDEDLSEDESSMVSSPSDSSIAEDSLDDNIPTSTTSGFKRKASRLETAIGNIVRRRRFQKRSTPSNSTSSVSISMSPSSPTVSTTSVEPLCQNTRGRSEILERILRSSTSNTVNNPVVFEHSGARGNAVRNDRGQSNDTNGREPFAKLRDLLTMPEDQLVKRRRLEYGHGDDMRHEELQERIPRKECAAPRNNILASLLQKGRQMEPTRRLAFEDSQDDINGSPFINHVGLSDNSSTNNISNQVSDERPYKCSLCDLRFKKLPLLNRHVKTHSHIKRYMCRFCSHAFKRSDNLLAHMRTSCKGIKDSDARFAGGVRADNGQMPDRCLSNSDGQVTSPAPARPDEGSLRGGEQCDVQSDSMLVSTTTASPSQGRRRQAVQHGTDFQARHSKLLEILSGSTFGNTNDSQTSREVEEDSQDEDMPLSLKVERRPSFSVSPSLSQTQFLRSQHRLYSSLVKQNELSGEDSQDEEENEVEQPLNLGSFRSPPQAVPSDRSRDHPEIVSILSRQPKSVVMMSLELRKLVGIDS